MAVLLGVAAAVLSGAGDFYGGLASRLGRVTAVAIAAHGVGIITALVVSPFVSGSPAASDMLWGGLAGVSGGLAILALYRGFATGAIAVVSPIAAVGAGGWTVLFAFATGDRPAALQIVGLVVGLGAIWIISRSPDQGDGAGNRPAGVGYGLLAGAGFGGLLILLSAVGVGAGIWPLLPARVAGGLTLLAVAAVSREVIVPHVRAVAPIAASGALTVLGNGAFILAASRGSLAVVSTLTAMFPAATVVLARIVLGEVLGPRRRMGLLLALIAVGLVASS